MLNHYSFTLSTFGIYQRFTNKAAYKINQRKTVYYKNQLSEIYNPIMYHHNTCIYMMFISQTLQALIENCRNLKNCLNHSPSI